MLTRRSVMLATLAAPAVARAQSTVQLRISTAAPPSDFLARACDAMKAQLEAAKVGIAMSVHPASTLFKQGTEVPALQRGNLEMSTMTTFEVAQQIPALGFLNRAYLFRDYNHLRHVFDGPIGADYRRMVAEQMGIVILATAYLGTRQVALAHKRNVAGPQDLAGVKLRMPAGPDWLLLGRVLGVSPVPMGMPELYLALKTGTVDGQENPLSIFRAAKLYEVSEQIVLTAHLLQPVFFNVAKPFWDRLSPAQQAAVQAAATEAAKQNDAGRLGDEQSVTAAMKARGLAVDSPDLQPFRALADKVYAEDAAAKAWDAAMAQRVAATA
jgi:tripartite ATP-independent transporter DctP family solute receptor